MVKGPENAQRKDTIKRSVFDLHVKTLLELKTIEILYCGVSVKSSMHPQV